MKKTIAHFIEEKIKTHQRFIYNQIVKIDQYRSIVIGPFDNDDNTEFPFDYYYNLNNIKDLKSFFTEQNVVAIHVHHGKHVKRILPICIDYNIPLIVSIRGRDGSSKFKSYTRNVKRYSSLVKHGAMYLPVCEFLAEELKTLGFPDEKIHVLYGGIDLSLFPYTERTLPKKSEVRILSVGRLVEKKGFPVLIQAFQQIHAKFPNTKLHIIGTGKDEQKIQSLTSECELEDAVVLKGTLDLQQISDELKKAHLFCLASQTGSDGDIEGIPNALKEAMASGLPVISTQHAGIPELIEHKVTGYLAPEGNDIELAKGIQFFLEHPDSWKKFTQKARKVIEKNFDLNKQIQEQQRLYSLLDDD
ncbi:MAG TPA: glycosyltransferase [Bacillus sp. (in: firmicutes)]|nr:glycosyltransferase [Bacillus sp. (in: firmicutes)]